MTIQQQEPQHLDQAWRAIQQARDRDLILRAQDTVPPTHRIQQALGLTLPVPETTLKLMATHERERRSKRKERLWWLIGILLTAILAAHLTH